MGFDNSDIRKIEKKMKEKLWFSLLIQGIIIFVALLFLLIIGLLFYVMFR